MDHGGRPRGRGLLRRIVLLVTGVLLAGELLVYLPSIARFRLQWLDGLVQRAYIAAVATRHRTPDPALEDALLTGVGALRIEVEGAGGRVVLGPDVPVDATFDLARATWPGLIADALDTLRRGGLRLVAVEAPARMEAGARVRVVFAEATLWYEMAGYSERILLLTLLLVALLGVGVVTGLRGSLVMPVRRLADHLVRFCAAPEDPSVRLRRSGRQDEIGTLEYQVECLERDIRALLRQRARLAAVGAAVSRLHHDLRNMLASAMLVSDSLEASEDPEVRRRAERIIATLERATALCEETVHYARSGEPVLRPRPVRLAPWIGGLVEGLRPDLRVELDVPDDLTVTVDPERFDRVLLNLLRNAERVLPEGGRIRIRAGRADGRVRILVEDDGPGIPEELRDRLFEPFASKGGTGLGLAICREIVEAHGGTVRLARTGPDGTAFEIDFPAGDFGGSARG